jgi:hypothetical protein
MESGPVPEAVGGLASITITNYEHEIIRKVLPPPMMVNEGIAFIPIVFFLVVLVLGLGVISAIVLIIRGILLRRDDQRLGEEETMQLHRLMDQINRMEARISNLETILLERGKRTENNNIP